MTDVLAIMNEIGDDAELLLVPDEWLENQRLYIQQKMALMAERLDGVLTAQRVKRQLQQSNLVAIRCVEKHNGQPSDIIIKVCPITEALTRLSDEKRDPTIPSDVSDENAKQQICVWRSDGYDIDTIERFNKRQCKHGQY